METADVLSWERSSSTQLSTMSRDLGSTVALEWHKKNSSLTKAFHLITVFSLSAHKTEFLLFWVFLFIHDLSFMVSSLKGGVAGRASGLSLTHHNDNSRSDLRIISYSLHSHTKRRWRRSAGTSGFPRRGLNFGMDRQTKTAFVEMHLGWKRRGASTNSTQLCLFYEAFHHLLCMQRRWWRLSGKFNPRGCRWTKSSSKKYDIQTNTSLSLTIFKHIYYYDCICLNNQVSINQVYL